MSFFSCIKINNCRFCGSSNLELFCDLGDQPPSNSFLEKSEFESEKCFPLRLYFCHDCFLVQLLDVVSSKSIFDDYYYQSSSSKALVNSFKKMCNNSDIKFGLKENDLIVDIGCNDGIILDNFKNHKYNVLGIEPSNIYKIAKNKGHEIINDFFNINVANKVIKKYGHAKLITATNMYAHVNDMTSLTQALKNLLHMDGTIIIEVSYLLDMIDSGFFDVIYHEHLSYYSITSLNTFLNKYDLSVYNVERHEIGASGPAIRLFIKHSSSSIKINKNVVKFLEYERTWGVNKITKLKEFNKNAKKIKKNILSLIKNLIKNNHRIGGFAAPAKGNTLLNFINANENLIFKISENNLKKIGKFTPGSHIEVISDNCFLSYDFEYALLLAWNYKDFFIQNSEFKKLGGKFIIPFPSPHIL